MATTPERGAREAPDVCGDIRKTPQETTEAAQGTEKKLGPGTSRRVRRAARKGARGPASGIARKQERGCEAGLESATARGA